MFQLAVWKSHMQDGYIELRQPNENDMQFIRWLWSDPETMKPVGGPIYLTAEQAQHWFNRMIKPGSTSECYCLIFNSENEPIGEISFHRLDSVSMRGEFNVKIASTKQGKGYAKKAMLLFLDFFFNKLGGQVMIDNIALDNFKGQQVLLRFGFEHDLNESSVFRVVITSDRFNNLYASKTEPVNKTMS
jgi:RimJ/RimL family protein N-acetyltransferase